MHLPGYEGDLYGASLDVAFVARLRAEAVFADVEALVAQIGRDVEQTLEIFKKFSTFDLGTARIDIRSATLTMWVVTLATCYETSDS